MAIKTNFSDPVETIVDNTKNTKNPSISIDALIRLVTVALNKYKPSNSREVSIKIDEDMISSTQLEELTYNINSDYNFYTDFYEDITKENISIAESGLPNLYIYGDDLNNESDLYNDIITVKDNIQIKATNSGNLLEYFDNYAEKYARSLNDGTTDFSDIATLEQEIYFSKKLLIRIDDVNKNSNSLPFSIKLDFQKPAIGSFTAVLEGTGFTDDFCSEFVAYSKKNFQDIELKITADVVSKQGETVSLESRASVETILGKKFDDYAQFQTQIGDLIRNYSINSIFRLGDVPTQSQQINNTTSRTATAIAKNQSSSIARSIKMAILMTRLSQIIKNTRLTTEQFFAGRPFQTQLFMTQIDKQSGGQSLQSFYLPNISERSEYTLYDTQVKFGKNYIYSFNDFYISFEQKLNLTLINSLTKEQWIAIFEETIRINSKYQQELEDIATGNASNSTINRFLPVLIEAMFYAKIQAFIYYPVFFKRQSTSDTMAVFDHPPPPPEVQIDGLIGVDNKIFIQLNSSISEFKAIPILIQPEDKTIFENNVLSQKLTSVQDQLMFDGDDRPLYFQIFRLDFHPTSYFQFKDNFVTASTTIRNAADNINTEICSDLKTNHSTYLDHIEPNKNYYYMFRTVDIHGNISNPSPIYEVVVTNQEGTIYPLIKTVDLKKSDDKTPFKYVKRFLHIIPNALQTIVNEQESNYYNEDGSIKESADLVKENVVLGLTEEKVWNKNYRLKIRSKTTGKIIEIDFKFKHKTLPNAAICK
jgi:hypothetical protein